MGEILKPLVPLPKGFCHPIEVDFREIFNGIFYVQRTGCQWEMMPHDLPPYSTVYRYFKKWQKGGFWQQMHDKIRQKLRTELDRDEDSTVAIADSKLVKTTEKRGRSTARDGGKKVKGLHRHIVVDSQGLLIGVLVTEANASERLGAVVVLNEARDKLSKLQVLWVDQGYSGKNFASAVQEVCGVRGALGQQYRVRVEVIKRTTQNA